MESKDVKENNIEREATQSPRSPSPAGDERETSPNPQSPPPAGHERDASPKPQSPPPVAGYDPARIPSSVFSLKSGAAGEWSGASNDSLFSIQMGNSSFSNDYAIMYGKSSGDFDPAAKSGDLPRLDDWTDNSRQAAPAVGGLAPVMEQEEGSGEMSSQAGKTSSRQSPPALAAGRPQESPARNPRISDVSATSNMSFAFPVLVSDSTKKGESLETAEAVAEKGESSGASRQPQQEPPAAAAQKPLSRWFACFSCARCC